MPLHLSVTSFSSGMVMEFYLPRYMEVICVSSDMYSGLEGTV